MEGNDISKGKAHATQAFALFLGPSKWADSADGLGEDSP